MATRKLEEVSLGKTSNQRRVLSPGKSEKGKDGGGQQYECGESQKRESIV